METTIFNLTLTQRRLTLGWLFLALASLVGGGLFTILIVLSRTPVFQSLIPWIDFFHTALVVHVDLTVLVWFLSFAGVLWTMNSTNRCLQCGWIALFLAILGTLIICISPFLGAGNPLMNNYVPVLQMPIFLWGLVIFGIGFSLLIIRSFLASSPLEDTGEGALRVGLLTAIFAAAIAMIVLSGTYSLLPKELAGQQYYELLFWGSGHILQFTHTQLMLVVWLWLASVSSVTLRFTPRLISVLFLLAILPVLFSPVLYFIYEITDFRHKLLFTQLMQYGGLSVLPLIILICWQVLKAQPVRSGEYSALIFSIILFGVGGIIGFLISGSNVTVPAHYHGSIVAVTIAFMGITFHLMPRLGFREMNSKWVRWQPSIYGIGQLMHVFGLAWSGGYGVQRKTAGAAQGLESIQQIAGMGLMGLGGMIAIIAGIMFLVLVFLAMRPDKENQ